MNENKIKNSKWIGKNYIELTKKYNNKWIAVIDEKVVASDISLEKLRKKIEKEYKEKSDEAVYEFITDKKFPSFDTG
jgi:hypothetical protein